VAVTEEASSRGQIRIGRWRSSVPWKYATSEVLLIVIGILIALAASDWQSRRAERRTEVTILREMNTALAADLEPLERGLDRFQQIAVRVEVLLSCLRTGAPYVDSLDAYFGTVYGFQHIELNTAGYESLKSQGLELISDDGLRSHIARVYEQTYPNAERAIASERAVVLDLLRPYFLVHFRDLRFNESATPLDYDEVSKDAEFLNLVDYRLQLVRQNHIPLLQHATSEMRDLIEATALELGR